ncbi:uncharacterized protein si:dkey-261l7.2 [Corythoichthys intestinalis]|uniref:uncharacterized protein si:dkey-261l7.2 n=1 Tax=Corythoichthys intestinalis TaxID=161448 RepID=UPI0025A560D3|nr:uncharacterized protein si:dkey-261l7.2 [Corythoichthys intestinalis]XP_057678785.1 uncharacterized protein si:dkey-261l7.2 [Corythoichthys intestinalis]
MPQLTFTAVMQLVLLLSAFPAQYLILKWSGSTPAQRFHSSAKFIHKWKEWRSSYLNVSVWSDWVKLQLSKVSSVFNMEEDDGYQLSDIEPMMFDNDQGFFGASKVARSPRPPYVFLRVGEVVMDRRSHQIGVVVSWDTELRAPTKWVDWVYRKTEDVAAKTPHYKVFFSGPGPHHIVVAYLPQTALQRLTGTRPKIPNLDKFFTHFDGDRFVPKPWLREIFPEDVDDGS